MYKLLFSLHCYQFLDLRVKRTC